MDLNNEQSELLVKLQQHATKVEHNSRFSTDEAKTRNFLVEPFLGLLGWDCQDPLEVEPELTADVPGRKGEKVDYALLIDGNPAILVEAKGKGNRLGRDETQQLQRYFPHTSARLAVLTDGVRWHWYRGKSDPDVSHQMDATPFLTYDALDPTEFAAEWMSCVAKRTYDPCALLRLVRREEFTNAIADWVNKILINPDLAGAAVANVSIGLGASKEDELPLVVEATRAAWEQVLIGLTRQEASHQDGSVTPSKGHQSSDSPTNLSETVNPHLNEGTDTTEDGIEFKAHWCEELDLGDGRKLNTRGYKRAWRVAGGDWNVETNGVDLMLKVLGILLACDARRGDEASFATLHDTIAHFGDGPNGYVDGIPGFTNLYWRKGMNNVWKANALESIAKSLHFSPPAESPLASESTLEVWLPNTPNQRS